LISLNDSKWGIAVEECLKATIISYACHDSHDMKLLKDIFKRAIGNARGRYSRPPPIILSSFTVSYFKLIDFCEDF